MAADLPAGFHVDARAPFTTLVGPLLQADTPPPNGSHLALRVEPKHLNTLGLMHGGMTATLADSAMARAVIARAGRKVVTLSMQLSYLEAVSPGDLLEIVAVAVSADERFALAECEMHVGGQVKARASGAFRILRRSVAGAPAAIPVSEG